MRPRTDEDGLRFALAFGLRQIRPLLRRIVLETHADEHTDPANAAADRIIEHLRLCAYRVQRDRDRP
jgi:hypothetical protein